MGPEIFAMRRMSSTRPTALATRAKISADLHPQRPFLRLTDVVRISDINGR
jgi:hypothetical protein